MLFFLNPRVSGYFCAGAGAGVRGVKATSHHRRKFREGQLNDGIDLQTIFYRAPEVLFGDQDYGAAIDCWSAGLVLAELAGCRFHRSAASLAQATPTGPCQDAVPFFRLASGHEPQDKATGSGGSAGQTAVATSHLGVVGPDRHARVGRMLVLVSSRPLVREGGFGLTLLDTGTLCVGRQDRGRCAGQLQYLRGGTSEWCLFVCWPDVLGGVRPQSFPQTGRRTLVKLCVALRPPPVTGCSALWRPPCRPRLEGRSPPLEHLGWLYGARGAAVATSRCRPDAGDCSLESFGSGLHR